MNTLFWGPWASGALTEVRGRLEGGGGGTGLRGILVVEVVLGVVDLTPRLL